MKKMGYIFIILFFTLFILLKNYVYFNEKKEIGDNNSNNKITLKLMHDDTKDLTYQETEAIVEEKEIKNMRFDLSKETEYRFFDKKRDYNNLKMILDYIHLIILIQKYAGDLVCCWQMAISKIRKCPKPAWLKGFRRFGFRLAKKISSRGRYDHFDTSPYSA